MAFRLTLETKEAIHGFFGRYSVFSNFAEYEVEYEGLTYPSNENAFHASKFAPSLRKQFTKCFPGRAKSLGHKIRMKPEEVAKWDRGRRIKVMIILNVQKYQRHQECAQRLLATDSKYLEETNDWGDEFFGVCKGIGLNVLGHTLMGIRDLLRDRPNGKPINEDEMRALYGRIIQHLRDSGASV